MSVTHGLRLIGLSGELTDHAISFALRTGKPLHERYMRAILFVVIAGSALAQGQPNGVRNTEEEFCQCIE